MKRILATAEGNALLRYGAIRIYADSIGFDIASQEALAKALPGKSVSIILGHRSCTVKVFSTTFQQKKAF